MITMGYGSLPDTPATPDTPDTPDSPDSPDSRDADVFLFGPCFAIFFYFLLILIFLQFLIFAYIKTEYRPGRHPPPALPHVPWEFAIAISPEAPGRPGWLYIHTAGNPIGICRPNGTKLEP